MTRAELTTGVLLVLAYASSAGAAPGVLDPAIHLTRNDGFCSPGVDRRYTKPAWDEPAGLKEWGSFCAEGDPVTGTAETSAFAAPERFGIYLAGYVSQSGLTLEIENSRSGSRFPITPAFIPAEQWFRYDVRLPAAWRNDPVRLIARDSATHDRGWFAFSEPVPSNGMVRGAHEATQLLLRTLLSFTLILLPCLAFGAFAIRRGARDVVLLGLIQLGGVGICGYLGFWLYFIGPKLGHLFSFLFPFLTGTWFAWNYRLLDLRDRRILKQLLLPLGLVGAASLLIVFDGFLYGALEKPFYAAAKRFSHVLPFDNQIPYVFAEGIRDHHIPKPLIGDYLSSDRPPLQTGLVLSQYAYINRPRELGYTVHGVIVQSLWIFAAWLLLTAFDVDRRAVTFALAACLFSGFVFLNSFYVWPKLLAATYILASLAILITPKSVLLTNSGFACLLTGVNIALSMLSHGGSAFSLIGVALTIAVLRRRIAIRSLLLIAVTATLMYLPWMLYQTFVDPPGNRLTKMHLAGVGIDRPDPRPFGKALVDGYKAHNAQQIILNRIANVRKLFDGTASYWIEASRLLRTRNTETRAWAAWMMRGRVYFGYVVCLGVFAIGPIVLLAGAARRYRGPTWQTANILWIFTAFTLAVWCLLMFGPGTTLVHQGTYVTVLLGFIGSALALWAVSARLAIVIGCLQVFLNVLLYVVFIQPPANGGILAEPPPLVGCLMLCILSLVIVFWLLSKQWRRDAG